MIFSHLQISTSYSLLSSTISIESLVEKAKEYNYSALAITDHNVLYGALPFYKACIKAKIKPIIGLTADVLLIEGEAYSFVLLAKNNEGYKNLVKISSYIKTSSERRIPWEKFKPLTSGLIGLASPRYGKIGQHISEGNMSEAAALVKNFVESFEEDSFYLTMQNFGTDTDVSMNKSILSISKKMNIPIVATNNVHFLEEDDSFAYTCLKAIRDGEKLSNFEGQTGEESEYYFKSQQEMAELFSDIPDALENTLKIVDCCNVMIKTHQQLLPKYPIPKGENADELLKKLCFTGLKDRVAHANQQYIERLHYELNVIDKMGFNDYFLIVWDFMKFSREQAILTGPGRGSAAGSLVAYVLGITDVDPIEHGLLFERFLNPERISMPDIDIDFPDHRRDEVIEYVMNKYGKLHVAQILTFGTFATRAAIRDTARVFGMNSRELDQLSRLIPSRLSNLAQAYKESDGLQAFVNESELNRKLYETALKIEGLPRHTSTHAAGVVISEKPLTDIIPIQGGESSTYLTQFPMEDLEEIGLLKMDFLGLRNLSLLERVVKSVEFRIGKKINPKEISFYDEKTFNMLRKGDTTGIFQLESEGMRKVLRELGPTEFEDIVAVNALYRPGPMENIPEYIARKHGKKKVHFLHPDLKAILELTYGVIVYQEQIMQIASIMAGFTLGEADLLRRAVSKKKKEVLDQERKHFVSGALKKGHDEKIANETYDLIVRFANYGFNRSHAVAYSIISWQLSFLKANYPEDFMAALLTSVVGNEEKQAEYITEVRHMGIKVLSPSVNHSHYPFIAEKDGIRFSLAAIKGIGATTLKEIIRARNVKPFKDLFDFCLRVPTRAVNRKIMEGLILSGAFDEFGYDRAVLLATLDVAMEHAELMRPSEETPDLFEHDDMFRIQPKYVEVEPISSTDKLLLEKQALGLYISDHPVSMYAERFQSVGTVPLVELKQKQRSISIGVYLTSVKTIRTKKGELMAFIKMSDSTGDIEGVLFPETYKRYSLVCKEGEIVLVSGNTERRDGGLQFIVQEMQLAKELNDPEVLYLKIRSELHTKEILHSLHEIIRKHKGNTAIVLHYESTRQTIKLSKKDWIAPSKETLSEISSLLGSDCVILK
ncbi:DNA polymerase-3 subunit alpha [Lederbergia wuyishanensis]|uniref:DNA polymerase III subunit alpha n=1 Tax=Lederbergia wuyishanensis TaxID=1347903 RepID=A0ABU0D5A6_9BACI|nr:DNA polymerase III subunit alpha [Lederbergia wuyishanensis]MCJ8009632.1 DNA polymerase III subunit alpha [Lederbergia wuyishanensis]MDQ0343541.1 DNA polymerase-3 subunit alpha [Lederbergia wuyishanensis]